jgi:hypothetical protein
LKTTASISIFSVPLLNTQGCLLKNVHTTTLVVLLSKKEKEQDNLVISPKALKPNINVLPSKDVDL